MVEAIHGPGTRHRPKNVAHHMTSLHRLAVFLGAMALAAPIGITATAEPAGACSCLALTDAQAYSRSDAVFTGRLVDVKEPAAVRSSLDPATWVFSASRVYKGTVTRRQEVVTAISGASCGLEVAGPGKLLVFAVDGRGGLAAKPAGGQYSAGLCGGTRPLSERPVPASFGRGNRPSRR